MTYRALRALNIFRLRCAVAPVANRADSGLSRDSEFPEFDSRALRNGRL